MAATQQHAPMPPALVEPMLEDNNNNSAQIKAKPPSYYESTKISVSLWLLLGLIIGIAWGCLSSLNTPFIHKLHAVTGRMFLVFWAMKLYPQIIFNVRRGDTNGLNIDTYYLECIGFISLLVFSGYDLDVLNNTDGLSYGFELSELLLSINLMVCSAFIIIQMYRVHGYRHSKHKGINSISNRSNFFISTFIFFNVLYLILLYIPEAHGSTVVSKSQYFSSFMYATGIFLSIRWVPTIWRNEYFKRFVGISLSSVALECFGSISLLIMLATEGYNSGQYNDPAPDAIPNNVISAISRELLLSIVSASSFFCCMVLCNQSVRFAVPEVSRPRESVDEGIHLHRPVRNVGTHNDHHHHPSGGVYTPPPEEAVFVDVQIMAPESPPSPAPEPTYPLRGGGSPNRRSSSSSPAPPPAASAPPLMGDHTDAPSKEFWEPPHPAYVHTHADSERSATTMGPVPTDDQTNRVPTPTKPTRAAPKDPGKKVKKSVPTRQSTSSGGTDTNSSNVATVSMSADEKDNGSNAIVSRDHGF
jgi:hypothetical protein